MKITILKGEYLFTRDGTHVLDNRGFAIRAEKDTEVDILKKHYKRVLALLEAGRPPQEEIQDKEEDKEEVENV